MMFWVLLLSVGALYALVAVMRKSFVFAMIAALTSNASLWYLLHQTGTLGFDQHPQVWLIPPALCTLVAAYLNRHQLRESQLTAIRYAAATVIYASSTVEIFINGNFDLSPGHVNTDFRITQS